MLQILHSPADPAREPSNIEADQLLIPATVKSHLCYCNDGKRPDLEGVHQGQCYRCSAPGCPARGLKIAVAHLAAHQQSHQELTGCPCDCHDGAVPGQCESCDCPAELRRPSLIDAGFFARCDAVAARLDLDGSPLVRDAQEMSRIPSGTGEIRMTQ